MEKAHTRINWENYPSKNTKLNAINLNKMDSALDEVDNRVISLNTSIVSLDTTKANQETVDNTVSDWTFDKATGIATVTKVNGNTTEYDTMTVEVLTKQLGEWELISTDVIPKTPLCGIYANGLYVLGCVDATILYSTNGEEWMEAPKTNYSGVGNLVSIGYNKQYFYGITNKGYTLSSKDGINWNYLMSCGLSSVADMIYANGVFVYVGGSGSKGKIACSNNPGSYGSYTVVTLPEEDGYFTQIAYGEGKFVTATSTYNIYYSEDGINWTKADGIKNNSGSTAYLYGVAYGDGKFVVSGASGHIWYSEDGENWVFTRITKTQPYMMNATYANGLFMGTGYTGYIYYSKDGIEWFGKQIDTSYPAFSKMFSINNRVIVSNGSAISWQNSFSVEEIFISESIKDLYSKVNRMPYALVPIPSANWTESTEYTGYGYEFVQAIEDYYDVFPEWFLKPLSGIVPTEAEQTAFENIAAMKLDISDTSSPKLKFYAATQPTTDILVLVKGVQ